MRNRGRGNPFGGSGKIRDLHDVETTIRGKFASYKTMLEKEGGSELFTNFPSARIKQMEAFLDRRVKLAKAKGDTATVLALEMYRAGVVMKAEEEKMDQQYTKDFYAWLMGHGTEEDHSKTPWGRVPHALELPDVRKVLEEVLEALFATELYLVKLIYRTPSNLAEYAIYYKYVLNYDHWTGIDDVWIFLDFPALVDGAIMLQDPVTGEHQVGFVPIDLPPPQVNLHLPPQQPKITADDILAKLGMSFVKTKYLKQQLYDLAKAEAEDAEAAHIDLPPAELDAALQMLNEGGNEDAKQQVLDLVNQATLAQAAARDARLALAHQQREQKAEEDRRAQAAADAAKQQAKEDKAAAKAAAKAERRKAKEQAASDAAARDLAYQKKKDDDEDAYKLFQQDMAKQQTGLLQNMVQLIEQGE